MEKYNVLHSEKAFDVIETEGMVGLKSKTMSVAIMPYLVDSQGMIERIGMLKEFNPFRAGGYANTLITGTVETEDDLLFETVIRELEEEGGYKVPEGQRERIIFLGAFFPYKDSDRMIPTFAVDVTGLQKSEPAGDGSEKESLSEFVEVPTTDVMITSELLPLAAFLKLFNYFIQKSIASNVQS
jgi:8-oxo-dGTP pyrophosphatase MutT (NUDIX family)